MYYFKNILLITVSILVVCTAQQCGFNQQYQVGSATYYYGYETGACSFGDLFGKTAPGTPYIAALSESFFDGAKMCGVCFEITSPYTNKTITVYSTDLCPSGGVCSRPYHFDLSYDAFTQLGEASLGELENLKWRQVACGNMPSMGIKLKDGSNPSWVAYLVYNSIVQILSVEVQLFGQSNWIMLQRESYNYWVDSNDHTAGPYKVRVTSILNEKIVIDIKEIVAEKVISSYQQFQAPGCAAAELNIEASGSTSITLRGITNIVFLLLLSTLISMLI
ncbi:expansin-like protein [Heterostelium album PN500]|uniref:Expansin-like protein n=1 Tax=Heterostelium pallidum (strain ATCC 26659 / Pp 5 / PN500) TaxID=670386 RepID=D3B1K6_HETP5|nr:expansin-like protein [Heterostelium album PN500]EFA85180.1 expansin-like protein [Heterostelium album PN500]|eukprot:XP_020437289.1 expansin-like protein [Heterostelium album PN500]